MVGAIFKGKVQNLEPGLKAAFVDIGQEKNAFLHYWDMLPGANNDPSIEIVRENKKKSCKNEAKSIKDIPGPFPSVRNRSSKSTIGPNWQQKGLVRPPTSLCREGFSFLCPMRDSGISRKIEEKSERTRLKRILSNLSLREGMGVIIRTAGQNKPERFFDRDLHLLLQQWDEIEAKMQSQDSPAFLYEEPDLIGLTARDFLTDDIDRVQVDNKDDYNRLIETIQRISPNPSPR